MSTRAQRSCSDAPQLELSEQDVEQLAEELVDYHREFADLFFRKEQSDWGLKYLQGLLLASGNRCAESIALAVQEGVVRDVQRFVGQGRWEDEAILAKHRRLVAESLGDQAGVLIVDGTEFPKKGKHSVGVARQWCGARGKIDNCQAAVFLAYASELGHTLLDRRLYLPEEWFEPAARERWRGCGIPDGTAFRTRPELAWEMIEAVRESGTLGFSWLTCDETFGNNHELLERLEAAQIRYLADVPVSTLVWLERPETEIPAPKAKGRPPSRERLVPGAAPAMRVDELAAQLPRRAWRKYWVKDGEKGPIQAQFAFVRAVAVRDKLPGPELWVVFRRSLRDAPELKVFLSNAPADSLRRELVRVSGMRWPIESCLEEAKGSLGMDEYQTRSWRGWHHHMTLVMLAHHFLVRVQLRHKKGRRS